MRPLTLTERVVWAVTTTVAVLVGMQSVLAFIAFHAQEDDMTDTMLRREAQQLVDHLARPGLTPTGALIDSTRLSAWLTRGGTGVDAVPADMRGLAPGLYQLSPAGQTLHVMVADSDDGRITVVLDATASETRVTRFGFVLLALWLVCVAVTTWIARAVAAVAVGPIVVATRTIALSAPGDALPAGADSDEAGVLMETFNRFRDRVDNTVAREREFAANLDHEIRTPLTAIRTDAELLALEVQLAPAQQARLERITVAVDDITATMQSTLSYSTGHVAAPETIALPDVLGAACAALAERAAARSLRIDVAVDGAATLAGGRQALVTVIRNLVRNAIEHAAPATLRIAGDGRALTFVDDGPGIAPDVLAHVFDRHRHGHRADEGVTQGRQAARGLGLAIARRLCEMHGWQLDVSSPRPGRTTGTAFTLTLRPA